MPDNEQPSDKGQSMTWRTRLKLAGIHSQLRARSITRATVKVAESIAITIIVMILGAIALVFSPSSILASPTGYGGVLAQVAATAGTIVAIVFGLALAPVQRVAEALSPAILKVYARDRRLRFLFISLALICAIVFLLSLEGIAQISGICAFAIGILFIAIALDLLRWFYRITLSMLDPVQAVRFAIIEAKRVVHLMDKMAIETATHANKLLAMDQVAGADILDWKAALQDRDVSYSQPVVYWLEEFAEIAKKATTGQARMAVASLQAMTSVVCEYLSLREDDLSTGPDPAMLLASRSNADAVVRPACELLLSVAQVATRHHDEDTAICVVQQLVLLARFQTQLKGKKYEPWRGSLAILPIGYLGQLFKASREAKLQEVLFQGSSELKKLLGSLPSSETGIELRTSLVDEFISNAIYFYGAGNPALAEEVLAYLCEGEYVQYDLGIHEFRMLFSHTLRKLANISPIAVLSHAGQPSFSITHPLHGVLSLVRREALPYLLAQILLAAKVDPEREWVNPYTNFKNSLEGFSEMLRGISEKCEFGATRMFLHGICEAIFYLGSAIGGRLNEPIDSKWRYEDELAEKLSWLIWPLWVAYDKKKLIDANSAEHCCDTAVAVALIGLASGYPEASKTAASTVRTIALATQREAANVSSYVISDCLVRIDYLYLAAEHLGMSPLGESLRKQRSERPDDIDEARWMHIQGGTENRLRQLTERRSEYSYRPSRHMHAETLLDDILRKPSQIVGF